MRWEDIETVAAVVRTQSLLAAAKELGLRHSSVSRRVTAIEAALDEPLFLRGRRLVPTPLALEIEAHAATMATAARHLDATLAARQATRGHETVITTSDALVPLLLRAVARLETPTKTRLVITDEERELAPGSIDIALRPTGAPRRSLRGRRLGTLAVAIYRRKGSKSDAWILPSPSMRRRSSLRWLRAVPQDDTAGVECDTLLAMRDACVGGLGRAALPCFLAIDDPRLERVAPVADGTPIWLFVATGQHGKSRAFFDLLARALQAEKAAWQ
jgi:DNA-binding transcriptional LysR family regulator